MHLGPTDHELNDRSFVTSGKFNEVRERFNNTIWYGWEFRSFSCIVAYYAIFAFF